MIASIVSRARTMLMRFKVFMMWCGFFHRGLPALESQKFSWLDLPRDLMGSIVEKLKYEDMARVACVCKSWTATIREIVPPFYPVGKSPMLLNIRIGEGQGHQTYIHYHVPLVAKTFQVRSELRLNMYQLVTALDGKILMYKKNKKGIKFRIFDPLTNQKGFAFPRITSNTHFSGCGINAFEPHRHPLNLQVLGMTDDLEYVLFLIDTSEEDHITVHLYQHDEWALNLVYGNDSEPFHLSSNPVYFNGRFYCLGNNGNRLAVFNLAGRGWYVSTIRFRNKYNVNLRNNYNDICCSYLVDWVEKMMVVQVSNHGGQIGLFILDRRFIRMVFKETDDLSGRSLYLGCTLSLIFPPATTKLQGRIFVAHCHQEEPKSVILADAVYQDARLYFRGRDPVSDEEQALATTTMCCCCNNEEELVCLGSTQNQNFVWLSSNH